MSVKPKSMTRDDWDKLTEKTLEGAGILVDLHVQTADPFVRMSFGLRSRALFVWWPRLRGVERCWSKRRQQLTSESMSQVIEQIKKEYGL